MCDFVALGWYPGFHGSCIWVPVRDAEQRNQSGVRAGVSKNVPAHIRAGERPTRCSAEGRRGLSNQTVAQARLRAGFVVTR